MVNGGVLKILIWTVIFTLNYRKIAYFYKNFRAIALTKGVILTLSKFIPSENKILYCTVCPNILWAPLTFYYKFQNFQKYNCYCVFICE